MESPKNEGERLPVEGTSDLSARLGPSIPLEEFMGPRKPCPFCGSTDLEMNCWEEYIVCKRCDASAPFSQWQFRTPAGAA